MRGAFRADDAGPSEHWDDPSDLVEFLWAAMEEAGCPEDVILAALKPVEGWERSVPADEPDVPDGPDLDDERY